MRGAADRGFVRRSSGAPVAGAPGMAGGMRFGGRLGRGLAGVVAGCTGECGHAQQSGNNQC